ncbi:ATP-dependent protease HslVU, peptidase subunit (macronuclear) [Tetrahymena thermophila SB210]|uniref:ATP-dependent protease HslVU, peptidase subunit n=1 Tax=Tetrahymena thermophila (strain SB210) TaxID=312017 RepID=Q247W5_TETTS|nr:ATP-dependent protease HslVU, peptidase subunit [Tetrahymena thermophila SB210]EAS04180.1 ATP-dependent protease HslVU, peptidase subunit [Tetrahymena thermophila SB210]|eukprot:XP_001024425.1 ATP-dependent protease HslVU, peptidase subunit [Tetrahymena thermophila SB210]
MFGLFGRISQVGKQRLSIQKFFFSSDQKWRQTTILAVKKNNEICIVGDGQVSLGSTVVKTDGRKVRKLANGSICGFAGSLADAFTLMEGLENIMTKQPTLKACITYAKQWRTGKALRHLEATLLVVDKDLIVELDGTGNVLEIPEVIGIGSGGAFAECAARALIDIDGMSAKDIALKSMKIAADKCIYTNHNWVVETLKWDPSEFKQDSIDSIMDSKSLPKFEIPQEKD